MMEAKDYAEAAQGLQDSVIDTLRVIDFLHHATRGEVRKSTPFSEAMIEIVAWLEEKAWIEPARQPDAEPEREER